MSSTIELVDAIKAEHGDRVEVRIAGEPYFLAFMLYDLVQKWWLFAISFLIVVGMLWYLNKGWRGSVFPLIGVVATIVITLGLMGFTGYKLTTMMVLTPMLLLAIGTGHAVQVVRRYQSELHGNGILPLSAAERAISAYDCASNTSDCNGYGRFLYFVICRYFILQSLCILWYVWHDDHSDYHNNHCAYFNGDVPG